MITVFLKFVFCGGNSVLLPPQFIPKKLLLF